MGQSLSRGRLPGWGGGEGGGGRRRVAAPGRPEERWGVVVLGG